MTQTPTDDKEAVTQDVTQEAKPEPVAPTASRSRFRFRHFITVLSFLVMFAAPLGGIYYYLYEKAADQYASRIGFAVRSDGVSQSTDALGGLLGVGSEVSNDSEILFEYIHSHQLVNEINDEIDLWKIYSKPKEDFYFSLQPNGSIEDLIEYWKGMVSVYFDSNSNLIFVTVRAFSDEDAHLISSLIFNKSSKLINQLSDIALADSVSYAQSELETASQVLKDSQVAIADFRSRTKLINPTADVGGQTLLLQNLQSKLTEAQIELSLLVETTTTRDTRITQVKRRIKILEDSIDKEREKFGEAGDSEQAPFSKIVGEFEALEVDYKFAQENYIASRANYDRTVFDARRKSRYLAAFEKPTFPETAEFPRRLYTLLLSALFLFLGWAVLVLIAYSVKDRR